MSDRKSIDLPLMEAFYTVQGEGYHQGKAAWFIRLAGCDVGCSWCDVKDSWNAAAHEQHTVDAIVRTASDSGARTAVITGGEPLMHDLGPLTSALRNAGLQTHLETSGAYPLSGTWDWVCLSPKKFKLPLESVLSFADELKVVVYNNNDFEWGETFRKRLKAGCRLFLQPEWSRYERNLPRTIAYIKQHPEWQISLQIHKFMNIP